jgi:hypothetical protein
MSWEDTFRSWAQAPGETEQEKCDNAVSAVKKAIDADEQLSQMEIDVFPHGSYNARTNVRQNSDVDVCVRLRSTFYPDYPPGKTGEDYGNLPGSISYSAYKDLVGNALVEYFGVDYVKRGNKAFDVHANTYRVDADVVPTFSHRRYFENGTNNWIEPEGIAFTPDDSTTRIINWPDQTYTNGVNKNKATSERYKAMIRIIKKLRDAMQDDSIANAKDIASFLIESLIWNVPNPSFGHENYMDDVRSVLAHTFNNTIKQEDCNEWGEVNELKYLFRDAYQPWTRDQAHNFLSAAWDYVGFK